VVNKYGKEDIQVFLFPCESEEQAFADEIQQIAQLRYADSQNK
jgi:glutathione peroxidase-family protein